ncbi:MAG: cell division protein FtsQ [Clostridiaceae bacterium]|jgi:cell division protein FtsQ|nr:cell division protein FtsQ [Clostridiaceae bacterium]
MNEIIDKSKNELIVKRRRKKRIKNSLLLLLLLICIFITLCLKLQYFNITDFEVSGNRNITKNEIVKLSSIEKGNNIFYTNLSKARTNIGSNPYIQSVEIKRKLPSTLNIEVVERDAYFYGNDPSGKYVIVDNEGVVLEIRKEINNMKLLKILGFDFSKAKVSKTLPVDDSRKIKLLNTFTDLLKADKSGLTLSIIDISNLLDIKLYYGNICVMLGNSEDIQNKINKAVNIILVNKLKDSKGYIDVSYDGNPVFYIEK